MHELWKKLFRSEGIRESALMTVGNTISTGLGAIAIILASRFTTPAVFGIFSAIFAFMLLVSKFGDLGTNIALQRELAQPESEVGRNEKIALTYVGFAIKCALAVVAVLIGWVTAPALTSWLHLADINLIRLGWIGASAIFFFDYASVLAQSAGRFGLAIVVNAGQSIIKIVAITALIMTHSLSATLLVIIYGAAPLATALIVPFVLQLPPLRDVRSLGWRHLETIYATAKWTIIAVIAAAVADNIDVLLVQSQLTSTQTGWYAAAARIAAFASVAALSIGVVLNVRVAKYKTKEHLDEYLKKSAGLAAACLVGMIIVAFFAKQLILLTAGPAYLAGVPALRLLLYATGLVMATSPFVALFYTFNKPQFFALSGIVVMTLLIFLDWYCIPRWGIVGAALAKLVTRALALAFTLWYARRAYEEHTSKK